MLTPVQVCTLLTLSLSLINKSSTSGTSRKFTVVTVNNSFIMFAKAITVSGLATLASAHILMTNPVPYGKNNLDNSPLFADGSNFPCKQRPGVYDLAGASNVYAQGSKQQLSFQGTAVHGGGSCQVSVTTDLQPDKNSVWKVIKSIEGGCPAKGQTGNMGNSASAEVPYKYDFTIPKELASGNYTLAWTWFNKVGNREMYMNCAPLTVTGNGGSKSFMQGLPDMFTANNGNGCITPDSTDVKFPNPGKDVDQFNGATSAFAMPSSPSCQKPGSGGSDPVATSAAGGGQPKTSAPASSAPAPSTSAKIPGGVFITTPVGGNQPVATSQPAVSGPPTVTPVTSVSPPATTPPTSNPTPGNGTGSNPGSGSGGGYSSGTACSQEGAWNCIGGKSFQRCASGMWSAVQPMAAGVTCEDGVSADLKMAAAAPGRRSIRRAIRIRA